MAFGQKEIYERWITPAPPSSDYPFAYNFILIESIEQLKNVLAGPIQVLAFDTETTGLNHDESELVGYSFCFNGKDAYYVPVHHAPYKEDESDENSPLIDASLGEEAVDIFYNKLLQVQAVPMFNARFDMRVFEKYGFIQHNISAEEIDEKQIYKYDMSKVRFHDVQAYIWDTDTNEKWPSLKASEEYFLGWRGASFEETLGAAGNFYYLKPKECYIYAATDALGTFLLFFHPYVMGVRQECREHNKYPNRPDSSILDNQFLYPLMMMEDERTIIDSKLLEGYKEYYEEQIKKVQEELDRLAGEPFNPGSSKQKAHIFNKLNIVTLEYDGTPALTKAGGPKSDKEHIKITIDKLKLKEDDPRRRLMEGTLKYATLRKQLSTYTETFIKMCENSPYKGRLRFGYKTVVVPSGRLAAGGDKKNSYFADTNIQNIPKPHMTMVYYVKYNDLITKEPLLTGKYQNDNEEYTYNGEYTYKILDWVFKESPWNLGIPEWKIEGFEQKLNVRSAFCSDPDKLWVSCDYSAEELRVPALISKEPLWTDTFANDGDLHERMAKVIWGEENYNKQRRKQAKAFNFGILYGMTARNFANDLGISLEEAEELVDNYKKGAPVLFRWVAERERECIETGSTYTMFGRPRRLGWYLNGKRSLGMRQFGLRSCTNTQIQGTGGDILKMAFLEIYKKFYNNKYRNNNRKLVKMINTVHDEINYNVSREHIYELVPMIIGCMRFWFPDWKFPMKVGLAISNRWGTNIDFDYDETSHILIPDGVIPQKRYRLLSPEEQERVNRFGPHAYVEDPNGIYMDNPNYLHIVAPSGEPVTEDDYKVKEKIVEKEPEVNIYEEEPSSDEGLFDNLF